MLFFLDNQRIAPARRPRRAKPASAAATKISRARSWNCAPSGSEAAIHQDDVTSLARIITGWTFAGRRGPLGAAGSFVFNANAHRARRAASGRQGFSRITARRKARAARTDIARHPATAKFIATKFARRTVWPTIRLRRWWRG